MKRTLASLCLFSILLVSCGKGESEEQEQPLNIIGARIGVSSSYIASMRAQGTLSIRPSYTLGVFTSSYLAQGAFIVVRAAAQGIEAQRKLLAGQELPTSSETFALLQELGTVLQIDIVDVLNRASNRGTALNEYITSLKGAGNIGQRKQKELKQQEETFEKKRKEEKDALRDLESELRDVFRREDYGRAANIQEQIANAGASLAQTETKLRQTQDILDRYEELLGIAEERLSAIEGNREVLIAGLKVMEVPGIQDLDILDESKSFKSRKKRRGRSSGNTDIFGAEHIRK